MIIVKVELHGIFREYSGKKEYMIELNDGDTFEMLMQKLTGRLGDKFNKEVYEQMDCNKNLHHLIFLNNKNLFKLGGREIVLKDGDCITFLPPMAGG